MELNPFVQILEGLVVEAVESNLFVHLEEGEEVGRNLFAQDLVEVEEVALNLFV